MNENILEIKNLVTTFDTERGTIKVIDNVSFTVKKGEVLGIVGESGCGKSVTSLSIMRLLPKPSGKIASGEIIFDKTDLTKLSANDMYRIRGEKISMIFQEPMTALNPVHRVGKQMAEVLELHFPKMKSDQIKEESIKMLTSVGIPTPERRLEEFPHQLSGGIRQRVMIAMSLLCKPDILIADEPTTALDVTIQAQILDLIRKMQKDLKMAVIFITHDLGVIAEMCDRVVVMYAGKVVEMASVHEIFKNPKHPYTKGLLSSIPRLDNPPKVRLNTIEGMVPDIFSYPVGCRFENRCPYRDEQCAKKYPPQEMVDSGHEVSCFKWKGV